MNIDELLREAHALARDCVLLGPDGRGPVEGTWHGQRDGLWVAVKLGKEWLQISLGDERGAATSARRPKGGLPLFARPAKSLPPLDAIFLLGSKRIARWLAANDWSRTTPYNVNFRDRKLAEAYEAHWQRQCPLYSGGAHVQVGGWSMPWPDGDFPERVKDELVLWTFADSEPWVEVWKRKGDLEVVERIT